MSFLQTLKASLAGRPASQPRRESNSLLPPLEIPALIGKAPRDFAHYQFMGATLATISKKDEAGHILRRRGLVARMVLNDETLDGAFAEIEMLVSLRDLENNRHPDAQEAVVILTDLHSTKLYQTDERAAKTKKTASPAAIMHEAFLQASRGKMPALLGMR